MSWSWAGAGGGRSVPGCRGRGWPGLGLRAELRAGGEPRSDRRWQRLALLEVPFAGQGALFLLVFPLLVLLLLFLHRRGFQPAARQRGAATGAGLAPLWALPGRGAAVRAPRGATRRQGAGGGRARAHWHGCRGMSAVGVWPGREAGPCPGPRGASPRAAAPTLVPAVAGQCDRAATPSQEGEGGRHQTIHNAALPCAQLQAAIGLTSRGAVVQGPCPGPALLPDLSPRLLH